MSCALKLMKFVLFTINFLFLLIGLALLVAGAWAVLNISSFLHAIAFAFDTDTIASEMYQNAKVIKFIAYGCIGLGTFIFVVAFFGCCGVITDSICLLIAYSVIVSIIFVGEITCVLVFLLLSEKITPIMIEHMKTSFSENYRGALGFRVYDKTNPYSQAMDAIMVRFSCCGIYGPSDFQKKTTSELWHSFGRVYVNQLNQTLSGDDVGLPVACCQFAYKKFHPNATFLQLHDFMTNPDCPLVPIRAYNKLGCVDTASKAIRNYKVVLNVIPVILAVIEVIGVILASALAHELKQEGDQLYY